MPDLYPVLLRKEESATFGATLQHIVPLVAKGDTMSTKQIIIVIDGDEYDSIECKSIDIHCGDDNTVKVSVCTAGGKDSKVTPPAPPGGFVIQDTSTTEYLFKGDDLEAFLTLSEFRLEGNETAKIDDQKPLLITIESASYNIQDLPSVQNASMDLIDTENDYLQKGYKVYRVSEPKYIYSDLNNFKLSETAVLYKVEASAGGLDNGAETP